MNRKAALFLAAVMAAGSAVSVTAAETFADINDVPWGGAQAYINSVEKGFSAPRTVYPIMRLYSLFTAFRERRQAKRQ